MFPFSSSLLVMPGDECKSLGSYRVGGYLVKFGSPDKTDLSSRRDYFTPETDFGLGDNTKTRILWYHGKDPRVGKQRLGAATLTMDSVGVAIDAQLNPDLDFVKSIYPEIEANRIGWSSGTAPHLMERVKVGNAHRVTSWPIAEASLTRAPAEPDAMACAIKSLDDPALKGQYLGANAEQNAMLGALGSLADSHRYAMYKYLSDRDMSLDDVLAGVRSTHDEFRDTTVKIIGALRGGDEDGVKSLFEDGTARLLVGLRLADHLDAARAVVAGLRGRLSDYAALKARDNRPVPAGHREAFSAVVDEALGCLKALEPRPDEAAIEDLIIRSLGTLATVQVVGLD